MLYTKHWKQILKKQFSKKPKLRPKKFATELCQKWPGVNGVTLPKVATLRSPWHQFAMDLLRRTTFIWSNSFLFFLSDNCELTARSDKKNTTVQPFRGPNLGLPIAVQTLYWMSSEAKTGTACKILSLTKLSVLFSVRGDPHVRAYKHVETNHSSLDFIFNSSDRKFVPVGTIPSNLTPFVFLFLSDMWTDKWIRRKHHGAAPPGIEPGSSDCRLDAL